MSPGTLGRFSQHYYDSGGPTQHPSDSCGQAAQRSVLPAP